MSNMLHWKELLTRFGEQEFIERDAPSTSVDHCLEVKNAKFV